MNNRQNNNDGMIYEWWEYNMVYIYEICSSDGAMTRFTQCRMHWTWNDYIKDMMDVVEFNTETYWVIATATLLCYLIYLIIQDARWSNGSSMNELVENKCSKVGIDLKTGRNENGKSSEKCHA